MQREATPRCVCSHLISLASSVSEIQTREGKLSPTPVTCIPADSLHAALEGVVSVQIQVWVLGRQIKLMGTVDFWALKGLPKPAARPRQEPPVQHPERAVPGKVSTPSWVAASHQGALEGQ